MVSDSVLLLFVTNTFILSNFRDNEMAVILQLEIIFSQSTVSWCMIFTLACAMTLSKVITNLLLKVLTKNINTFFCKVRGIISCSQEKRGIQRSSRSHQKVINNDNINRNIYVVKYDIYGVKKLIHSLINCIFCTWKAFSLFLFF